LNPWFQDSIRPRALKFEALIATHYPSAHRSPLCENHDDSASYPS
jgi:hypothetical protein